MVLFEVLGLLLKAVVEVVRSSIESASVVGGYLWTAITTFVGGIGTASPLEIIIVVLLFGLIGYGLFRFIAGESKEALIFVFAIIFILILYFVLLR